MSVQISIGGFVALYIFMVTAFAGWVIIGRVPAILHTPLMSGSNFVHGIVVVGGVFTLLNASTSGERAIGFVAVLLGAGNVAGGFAVTQRMLEMFQSSGHAGPSPAKSAKRAQHGKRAVPAAVKSAPSNRNSSKSAAPTKTAAPPKAATKKT